jgi:NAD(P)-dependent dehydrogenase (short-subunit alcohol dehydrogenase family)
MPLQANNVVLVTGGTGVIGTGLIESLLQRQVKVIVPSRSQDSLDRFIQKFESKKDLIYGIVADAATLDGLNAIYELVVKNFGENGLDHVVSIQGGWVTSKGGISEATSEEYSQAFSIKVQSHLELARVFYPLLKKSNNPSPSFTIVSGAAGGFIVSLETSLTTIVNAATFGVALALIAESDVRKDKVRVNEYRISSVIAEKEDLQAKPYPKQSATLCGEALAGILSSDTRSQVLRPSSKLDFEYFAQLL